MKIVVAVRCYNEERNIDRFMRCYDFADEIIVSDGGSTDNSIEMLQKYPKVHLLNFDHYEIIHGFRWNPDAPHMNFVIENAKMRDPDWIILDDMDDVPNLLLQKDARRILENSPEPQVDAFRVYMWGEGQYFPHMNRDFDIIYTSLWAWKPKEVGIWADNQRRHGTVLGLHQTPHRLNVPYCLLHRSWHPDTIQQKIDRYNKVGLHMNHPFDFAGELKPLPEWARSE